MKLFFTKTTAGMLTMAALLTAGTANVWAASETTYAEKKASYGYLNGQQENDDRHAHFDVLATISSDAEREAYYEAQGIGTGSNYQSVQHLDAEKLVAAGIIDQATADQIAALASQKHDGIHDRYNNKADMTPEQRQALYEAAEADGSAGDTVSELFAAGIITQEQADAITAYLS